ncbi:MAG: Ig-like domain-containing protein [Methanobacterium paludis]|nr:Ig-like domain-containing protein [Methanobacterium paludis]
MENIRKILAFTGLLIILITFSGAVSAADVNGTNSSADNISPTVTNVDPTNTATNVAITKVITVNFSEPIEMGSNWIELQNNGTNVSINKSINGNVLTITPVDALNKSTTYTLLIHTGSVTDLAGNNVVPCVSRFTTDSTAPTVTSVDPANNAVNVAKDKVITVNFSEPIKSGNSWIEFQDSSGTLIPITGSISDNVLTITLNSTLSSGVKYALLIHTGSVTDLAGNNVAGYVTRFTTSTDNTAPTVASVDPANNAVNVVTNKIIKVTFTESIKAGNEWIELVNGNNTLVPINWAINGNVLTVTPVYPLTNATSYALLIHTGSVKDLAGNNVAPRVLRFTTSSISTNTQYTLAQIEAASSSVESFIETHQQLPSYVTISGTQVSMAQFLGLATNEVYNINNNLTTSILLGNFEDAPAPEENMTDGIMTDDEYLNLANNIISFMDSNGRAPSYASDISLGSKISFQSMVYMYSQILNYYSTNNETLPDDITIIPWLAITHPNETYNFNTQKAFTSIQAAINDSSTQNGDTITLGNSNYTENVVINKTLKITSLSTINATVNPLNLDFPVFTINSAGNKSVIQNLIIRGGSTYTIFIDGSDNNTISGNTILNGTEGILIQNAMNNIVLDNNITNSNSGIYIINGIGSLISGNTLNNLGAGIFILHTDNCTISGNLISNNGNGIVLYYSSATINYNSITQNNCGLWNEGPGTADAENNWWGSNNGPTVASTGPSDICITDGTVNNDQWLVLNVTSSCDRSDRNGTYYNYIVTADLTHNNQGNNTSSNGTLPDNIPINFNTTFGTLTNTTTTTKGKSTTTLNSTTGTTNVSALLNNQTTTITINATSINTLGIYNTRTGEGFTTIQAAIDSQNTQNGDTITLADGTYTENIVVNKKLTIIPISGANVSIYPMDPDNNVFNITSTGSGSIIANLTITGAQTAYGIFLNSSDNCTITNNTITDNDFGIYLNNNTNNTITGNNIVSNWNGIYLDSSNMNTVNGNIILENWNGIYLSNSNNNNISGNTLTDNWDGIYVNNSNSTIITGNNITFNMGGIYYYGSNNTVTSENNVTNNEISDIAQVDTTGIVMASDIYTCGPAALATVLKNLGINTTEEELITLAGTEDSGTTMYGLLQAAQNKGLIAKGLSLSVNQLKTNNIVLLTINGENHYSVVTNITSTTVYLADPSLGNIQMSIANFTSYYSGYALVVTENANDSQLNIGTALTKSQMQSLIGQGSGYIDWSGVCSWGRYAWNQISAAGRYVTTHFETYTKLGTVSVSAKGNNSSWSVNVNGTVYGAVSAASVYVKHKHVRYTRHKKHHVRHRK